MGLKRHKASRTGQKRIIRFSLIIQYSPDNIYWFPKMLLSLARIVYCFVDFMPLVHNTLVLSERRVSFNPNLLVERETEVEREIEVVRELKESLSSWDELGFYFQDMDTEIINEELRELKESAVKDCKEAQRIIQLLGKENPSDLQRIRRRGEELAVRLQKYYPQAISRMKVLLSKSQRRRGQVRHLLKEDTLDRLSRSTILGDETSLLNEVLEGLVEQLEKQEPGRALELCSLLEDVEWGTQTASTIDIDGFDSVYDFLVSIFERAEGYDFSTGMWTGSRDQTRYEGESKIGEIAREARLALIGLLEEWKREHRSIEGEQRGR